MTINQNKDGNKLTVALEGRLDTTTAPQLEAEVKNSLAGVNDLTFDFAGLEYISSAGLRILMTAQKAMSACGGKMSVSNPNAVVKGVFDIPGMDSVFNVVYG